MIPEFIVNERTVVSHNTNVNFHVVLSSDPHSILMPRTSEINPFLLYMPIKSDLFREQIACLTG